MIRSALLAAAMLACAGCAYVGEPAPPALKLPNRVTDLTAVQKGPNIRIQFTMSKLTTEGLPIEDPPEVDLRIGPVDGRFDERTWAAGARKVSAQPGQTKFETPLAGFVGRDVVVGVRLVNDRGRDAGLSNVVVLPVTEAVAMPAHLTARATGSGVELRWDSSSAPLFRVFRKNETGQFAALGDTEISSYLDATAGYGKPKEYFVQGLRKTGAVFSESENSSPVAITPEDVFPPAVPANVTAVSGTKSVELSWNRNTETDLAGYRVFRAEGDGPFAMVADKLAAPSYSDHGVKAGGRYRYSVTAFDQTGNESERSAAADVTVY